MKDKEVKEVLRKMLLLHPELCPHTFEMMSTRVDEVDGKRVVYQQFKCKYCGQMIEKPEA